MSIVAEKHAPIIRVETESVEVRPAVPTMDATEAARYQRELRVAVIIVFKWMHKTADGRFVARKEHADTDVMCKINIYPLPAFETAAGLAMHIWRDCPHAEASTPNALGLTKLGRARRNIEVESREFTCACTSCCKQFPVDVMAFDFSNGVSAQDVLNKRQHWLQCDTLSGTIGEWIQAVTMARRRAREPFNIWRRGQLIGALLLAFSSNVGMSQTMNSYVPMSAFVSLVNARHALDVVIAHPAIRYFTHISSRIAHARTLGHLVMCTHEGHCIIMQWPPLTKACIVPRTYSCDAVAFDNALAKTELVLSAKSREYAFRVTQAARMDYTVRGDIGHASRDRECEGTLPDAKHSTSLLNGSGMVMIVSPDADVVRSSLRPDEPVKLDAYYGPMCSSCSVHETVATPLFRCAQCRHTRYCSKVCQRTHWPTHRSQCVPRSSIQASPTALHPPPA